MQEIALVKILLFIIRLIGEHTWLAERLYNWFKLPRAATLFEYRLNPENENDYCHLRQIHNVPGRRGWFFRVGVVNKGRIPIKGCDVRIEKMEQEVQNELSVVPSFSPVFLHWANNRTDEPQDIHPGDTPTFLDIVQTVEGDNHFMLFVKSKHMGVGVKVAWPPGEYVLSTKTVGENINPVSNKIRIESNGNWEELRVTLLQ